MRLSLTQACMIGASMLRCCLPAGNKWETCEMESQRTVMLTLHPSPPQPLPKGRPLGLCIATVRDKDTGETRLRVLLLPVSHTIG